VATKKPSLKALNAQREDLMKSIDAVHAKVAEVDEQIIESVRRAPLVCPKCDKRSALGTWTYLYTYSVTYNTGDPSRGTEYDKNTGIEDDNYLRCPKCNREVRTRYSAIETKLKELIAFIPKVKRYKVVERIFTEREDHKETRTYSAYVWR
jgi:DNA-directed RNA polymerase subunit M/transcription elongation factor TFIIS